MESAEEGKSEKTAKNFGKKVDQFMSELNEAGEKLQNEFQAKYEDLKQAAEKVKREAESTERWKEVETSLKKAGDELSRAFKAAFSKRQK